MSVLELIEAEVEEALARDDEDVSHTYCCDPDVALCGVSMAGWVECDGCDDDTCIRCDVIDEAGVPCGKPFCRLRRRLRSWRSR